VFAICGICLLGFGIQPVAADLPNENECPEVTPVFDGSKPREDATPVLIKPGMVLLLEDLLLLRQLIPPEFWRYRQVFFHEGMRLEIGPCYRRYPVP
jgi:hypothetical protein